MTFLSRLTSPRTGSLAVGPVRGLVLGLVFLTALALAAPRGSSAAPIPAPAWHLYSTALPTIFKPGSVPTVPDDGNPGFPAFQVEVTNIGALPTDGSQFTLVDHLPDGTLADWRPGQALEYFGRVKCTGNHTQTVTCVGHGSQFNEYITAGETLQMRIPVDVASDAGPMLTNTVTISGGGAASAHTSETVPVANSDAPFGIEHFNAFATNADGSPATQAGSHPYEFTTEIAFTSRIDEGGNLVVSGSPRQILADLPAGFVGNPTSATRCSQADFTNTGRCPNSSIVGVAEDTTQTANVVKDFSPIFNLDPPPGAPAQFGIVVGGGLPIAKLTAGVRTGGGYGLHVDAINVTQALNVLGTTLTFWGTPFDPRHDPLRGFDPVTQRTCLESKGQSQGSCSVAVLGQVNPLLSLPTSCSGPLTTAIQADSYQEPGNFDSASSVSRDITGNPIGLDGCNQLDFAPTLTTDLDTAAGDSPAGLHVGLHIPQSSNPNSLAEAHLKKAEVSLPSGIAINPSSADGLAACGAAEIELSGPNPAACPPNSKIGSVEVDTPLVDHPLPGAVYLARQAENPFNSLFAIYIAVDDPQTGVVVKLPGKVEADSQTGQLKATFDDNPQLPFEDFKLDFFGGPRATLTTPASCGSYSTASHLEPWSAPEAAVDTSASFKITSGPGGKPCASPANSPHFEAGTISNQAGAYSPFVLRLSREDGTQRLSGLDVTLPKGLTGKLAGVQECSDAAIATAEGKGGAAEKASPSCPLASELGTVNVGAGSGPSPFYVQGHAYLAGPYKGAPFSMAIVTPAVAGPFDLGTVVVRAALFVNPYSAQITVKSDPFPQILSGVPLDLRSVAVNISRNQFTLNPTSCDPTAVAAAVLAGESVANLASPFQVAGCSSLKFKPKLQLSLTGATRRRGHPALKAVVTYPKGSGYANIARAQVGLPHSEFLDQGNLDKVCTQPELNSQTCPKKSIYGHVKAWTPLLDEPLEGPVYLGVGFGYQLPALVADLNGQIRILLKGKVDTDGKGGIRNTFETVPDAPVSRFVLEMKGGGKYGLLENSEDICRKPQRAGARFLAANGMALTLHPLIGNDCGSKGRKKSGKGHKR